MNAIDTMAQDLEALRRDRDDNEQRVTTLEEELGQVMLECNAERDRAEALAASLEKIFYDAVIIRPGKSESEVLHDVYDEAGKALSAGSDALARRDARMKAEGLEKFANEFGSNCDAQDVVIRECFAWVDEYRRQSEGEDHE